MQVDQNNAVKPRAWGSLKRQMDVDRYQNAAAIDKKSDDDRPVDRDRSLAISALGYSSRYANRCIIHIYFNC